MKYSDNLSSIKSNLVEEAKKMLPLSYNMTEADGFWSVYVDDSGKVEAQGYAQESGIYIGKSIEDLSLSDIALLIDNKLGMNMHENLSAIVGKKLLEKQYKLITAESCIAGLIASTVAETSGSSQWLEGGFIVYTPETKKKFLGVSLNSIEKYNITSEQVAYEMAEGAIENSYNANVAIAVTGVAGPNGGTEEIPVGTICIAWARVYGEHIQILTEKCFFKGSRNEIREQVVEYSLKKLVELI